MSDTDADDSTFDKEAERERLREKYGDDSADRAETERMSELLLQGATMTNRHCGECGNPIFRYEGQAFCSVCEEERPADGQDDAGQQAERPMGRTEAEESTDSTSEDTEAGTAVDDISAGVPDPRQSDRSGNPTRPEDYDRPEPDTADPDEVATPERPTQRTGRGGSSGDVGEARAALLRTLSRMASQAETTDEVTRAKQYLEAAREAAEALAAVDRVRQR